MSRAVPGHRSDGTPGLTDGAGADSRSTGWRELSMVTGLLVVLYAATATWSLPYGTDPLTNALTGWYLAEEGTVVVAQHDELTTPDQRGNTTWIVPSPSGPVSQYPPGPAAVAAVAYAIADVDLEPARLAGTNRPDVDPVETTVPPVWPATLSAVLMTALAAGAVTMALRWLGATSRDAIVAGLVFGTATGAWSVASDMSWSHGPAMLAVAVAGVAASRGRWWLTGFALGAAVLARPHLAVIAAVLGLWVGVARRDWRPTTAIAVGSGLGAGVLLGVNRLVWQAWTITGGYNPAFADRVVGGDLTILAANLVGGLFDPVRGLLVWAPFLLVLVPAAWLARRELPDWTVGLAIGGLAYLLVQWQANRFSGGGGFFAYRYPLETLTAAAPALWLGWDRWVRGRVAPTKIVVATLLMATAGQAVGAILG